MQAVAASNMQAMVSLPSGQPDFQQTFIAITSLTFLTLVIAIVVGVYMMLRYFKKAKCLQDRRKDMLDNPSLKSHKKLFDQEKQEVTTHCCE